MSTDDQNISQEDPVIVDDQVPSSETSDDEGDQSVLLKDSSSYAKLVKQLKCIRLKSTNEHICLACMSALRMITGNSMDVQFRSHLKDDKDLLMKIVSLLRRRWRNVNVGRQIFAEVCRFLRNVTVDFSNVQNMILEHPDLVDIVISKVVSLSAKVSKAQQVDIKTDGERTDLHSKSGTEDSKLTGDLRETGPSLAAETQCENEISFVQIRCAIQFLGNLVTNHDQTKQATWPKILSISKLLMNAPDEITRKYATMCIYTCIVGMTEHRDQLLSCSDSPELIACIAQCMVDNNGSEWALYILEDCLNSSAFLKIFYCLLPERLRELLLDICYESLVNNKDCMTHNIIFIAKQFELKADVIFCLKDADNDDSLKHSSKNVEPLKVIKLLEMLCLASSMESSQRALQKCSSLLCSVTFLLRGIHLAGKEPNSIFKPGRPVDPNEPEFSDDVVFGLKRDLIKLITNLCYKNKVNQDKLREFGGIPLLMDCCKLDSKNPFIMEYVIFAIRAVTEGNLENQELISKMEPLPADQSSTQVNRSDRSVGDIRDMDVERREASRPSEEDCLSKSEQALKDVQDLFR